ncbi:nuclear transport factor 2 family protein [Novosphingobium album (ex Liu et al. 2023)]|uniref:Nuclear transport factor 2 family protein n=1 Tax=Novosphingobium album (ex Liu et al. 2023) TaxID=3031130 RepID=A0ABT5WN86_9SPHN|nr:nuclear transport factor 2 family protein [Novosphingobium album (ex Liu et al. 2023)]MDE8651517.1 nuclear transport factor 2 family protein [Novosphingobium album (ex Liu et al. 2023)]
MDPIAEIAAREADLRQAMLAGDVAALDRLLADDLIFTNQDGQRLTKADDLSAHRSGLLRIVRLDPVGAPVMRLLGDAAIACVTVDLAGTYAGQPFGGVFAYTRVWHRAGEAWRVAAGHCSPVA